ncbi:MAG: hypothetical protein JWQ10_1774 [Herbaspirillum sp.]|jgi:hypothetical protein|nr:hypothetical protein [Herbaspirillum sp.]
MSLLQKVCKIKMVFSPKYIELPATANGTALVKIYQYAYCGHNRLYLITRLASAIIKMLYCTKTHHAYQLDQVQQGYEPDDWKPIQRIPMEISAPVPAMVTLFFYFKN